MNDSGLHGPNAAAPTNEPRDYEEAAAWTLERLLDFMDVTWQLFDGADSDEGWAAAVTRLQDLYNATVDALSPVAERLKEAPRG